MDICLQPFTVVVCGGRLFDDGPLLYRVLSALDDRYNFTHLIHGDAQGADKMAGEWAADNWVACTAIKADWKRYGKQAGLKRNNQMIKMKPDLVVAFEGNQGTADTIKKALRNKILTIIVQPGQLLIYKNGELHDKESIA